MKTTPDAHLQAANEHLTAAINCAKAAVAALDDSRCIVVELLDECPGLSTENMLSLDANRDVLNAMAVKSQDVAESLRRTQSRLGGTHE